MVQIYDKETGAALGTISESQLQFMIDQLEEESETDQDYYINRDTLDMFEAGGADPELLAFLGKILGSREDMELSWVKE